MIRIFVRRERYFSYYSKILFKFLDHHQLRLGQFFLLLMDPFLLNEKKEWTKGLKLSWLFFKCSLWKIIWAFNRCKLFFSWFIPNILFYFLKFRQLKHIKKITKYFTFSFIVSSKNNNVEIKILESSLQLILRGWIVFPSRWNN